MDAFRSKVLNGNKPVIVQFTAAWCGPCGVMRPLIRTVGEEREDVDVFFADVDREDIQSHAMAYNVRGVPTIYLFSDGIPQARYKGGASITSIHRWVDEVVGLL